MISRLTFLLSVLLLTTFITHAQQLQVDTTGGNVMVTGKQGNSTKTLRIYRTYLPGKGKCHKAIYQPDAAEFGDEPPTLHLTFSAESAHIRAMIDAASKKKQYNFSQFSVNILPYTDLVTRLADIYTSSPEWNDYLKKAGSLKKETTLYDGSVVTETAFDEAVAAAVLEKSDFLKQLQDLFQPYGYKVSSSGFPDDHQQVLSSDDLIAIGKNGNLVVPVPSSTFILTKVK